MEKNKTLRTDYYELTMAQTYFNDGKQKKNNVGNASDREIAFGTLYGSIDKLGKTSRRI